MIGAAVGGAQGFQLGLHGLELGMVLVGRIVALDVDNGVVGTETSEGVDVRIGVVARQIAVVEPKDAFGAEAFAEQQFDLSAIGHRHRVAFESAVGIEEVKRPW